MEKELKELQRRGGEKREKRRGRMEGEDEYGEGMGRRREELTK